MVAPCPSAIYAGRFWFSEPSAYATHDPIDGNPVKPRPVTNVNCAVEWSMRSVVIDRTNVVLSTTFWKYGSRSETCRPLDPHCLNFHGLAMICCDPFSARPLISNGAGFPSYFISAGFGSNISIV